MEANPDNGWIQIESMRLLGFVIGSIEGKPE
jgi:hypothetical protein